jgi:hypothetical protein
VKTRDRTSRHRRYSDTCGGEVTVLVTPTEEIDRHGKTAVQIRVRHENGLEWRPTEPLWLSLLYEADSRRGRIEAANAAVGFFESSGCGAQANPSETRRHGQRLGHTRDGRELIENLHGELWAPAPRAAKNLHDAYRVARPQSQAEYLELAQAFIDELNKHAPDGVYFGTPTGNESDLGWHPIKR